MRERGEPFGSGAGGPACRVLHPYRDGGHGDEGALWKLAKLVTFSAQANGGKRCIEIMLGRALKGIRDRRGRREGPGRGGRGAGVSVRLRSERGAGAEPSKAGPAASLLRDAARRHTSSRVTLVSARLPRARPWRTWASRRSCRASRHILAALLPIRNRRTALRRCVSGDDRRRSEGQEEGEGEGRRVGGFPLQAFSRLRGRRSHGPCFLQRCAAASGPQL